MSTRLLASILALSALPACGGAPAPEVIEDPDLVVVVRTTDLESRRWYYDAYPALVAAGWRVQVYRVPSIPQLGKTAGPMFSLRGDVWHGYPDRASHFRRLGRAAARPPAADGPSELY